MLVFLYDWIRRSFSQKPIYLPVDVQLPSGALSAPNNPSSPAGPNQPAGPPFPLVEAAATQCSNHLRLPNLRRKRHSSDPLVVPIIQQSATEMTEESPDEQPGPSTQHSFNYANNPHHPRIERVVTYFQQNYSKGGGRTLAERRGIRLKKSLISPLINAGTRRYGGE